MQVIKFIGIILAMLLVSFIFAYFYSPHDEQLEEVRKWCKEYKPNEPCSVNDTVW